MGEKAGNKSKKNKSSSTLPYVSAPALKAGLAEMPARGQLFLVEVNDFHLGLLPNELAGVHEGAVPSASQAIDAPIYSPQFLRRLEPSFSAR
jgi:hypothetical protein